MTQIIQEPPLPILAKKINILVENSERQKATYIEFGEMLIVARERVKKETKFTFSDWCQRCLVKKDGRPFSFKTIENYIYLASDPERVEKQKTMHRENIKKVRAKASGFGTAVTNLFTKQTSAKDQCDVLMCVWEQCSQPAQERFLLSIGARL